MRAIGNRSSLLLMREAFYGTSRFDDFASRVGLSEAVTAARLRELVALGVLRRQPYREAGQRTRHEYLLTDAGRDLLPVAISLMQWGDSHLTGADGAPIRLTHHDCGADVAVRVQCSQGHDVALADLDVNLA
jgi:DNA-binding HxlR family transcriptional regulator